MIRLNGFLLVFFTIFTNITALNADEPAYNNHTSGQALGQQQQAVTAPDSNQGNTSQSSPVEAIQSSIIKLNQLTSASIYSPQMMMSLIDKEVAPMFDFHYIAHEVLLAVNASSDEDVIAFVSNKLKINIITTLLSRLAQVNSTSVRFISARPILGGKIAVQLKVTGYSRYGLYLDLLFHQDSYDNWKIFDIVLNQDSLINYYQKMVSVKYRRYGFYGMLSRI